MRADDKASCNWRLDLVKPNEVESVKHDEITRGIAARINTVHLPDAARGPQTGTRDPLGRTSSGPTRRSSHAIAAAMAARSAVAEALPGESNALSFL